MQSIMKRILFISIVVALTVIFNCSARKVWYPPHPITIFDKPTEPVKFVLTFPAYYQATKDFAFNLVLFESPEYDLPVSFTATLTDNYDGLQQHAFSKMRSVRSVTSQPSVSIDFKNQRNLEQYRDLNGRPAGLAEKFIFIQTDKAMYKPTQAVHFRVLALNRELEPLAGRVSVTISDAKRNKIRMWTNQELERGIFGESFTLSDFVNFGDWTISVSGVDMTSPTEKTFTVQQYVLPKYEAKLEFPNNYLLYSADDSTYHGYVRAKYTFGKPIRGKGVVTLVRDCSYRGGHFVRWDLSRERAIFEPIMVKNITLTGDGSLEDGKFTLEGLNKAIFRMDGKMTQSNCNLVFKVNVTEELTGEIVSTGEESVTLYRDRYLLKVHDSVAKTIKPGLPFTMRVQVTQPDGSPITESVDVLAYHRSVKTRHNAICGSSQNAVLENYKIVRTDEFGIASASIDVPSDVESVIFNALIRDLPEGQLCDIRNIPRSRSNQAVSIVLNRPFTLSSSIPKVGDKLNFKIKTSFATDYVYFLMAQNGHPFFYKRLDNPVQKDSSGTEYSIDVELPADSAPRCAAVAWTVENSAHEVLADAVEFKVDGLIRQSVTAEFSPAIVRPGGSTELKIKTSEPGSLVAMFAVDKSVKLLRSGNDITVDDVVSTVSSKTTADYGGYRPVAPLIWRCWRCGWWPFFVDSSNADSVFRGVGMVIKSNAHTDSRPMEIFPLAMMDMPMVEAMAAPGPLGAAPLARAKSAVKNMINEAQSLMPSAEVAEAPTVRMLFPETWFWSTNNATSDSEVSQVIQAPDTITTWVLSAFAVGQQKGFGALQKPAELTVFQPFFVNLDIPYATVIRKEQFAIKAVVFNYQSTPQTVILTLKKSMSFKISSDGGKTYASDTFKATVNVRPNDGESVPLWLKPQELGEIILELEGVSAQGPPSSDAMQKKILVEPEGETRFANRPIFIRRENDNSYAPISTTINVNEMFGNAKKSQVVEGSRFFQLQVIGDLLGPALTQLGNQVRLPTGCGEQTMVILAPNVYIYKYLKSVGALTPELETKTTDFVLQGYQRELTYQRSDGGFSAFGENDRFSSTWLTAFVMRCFHAATKYVKTPVDRSIIERSWSFIKKHANSDGMFSEPGRVIHHDMKGGATSQVNLAAYIYATYAEAGGDKQFAWDSLLATRSLLVAESKNESANDPYQLAIMAYATSLLPEDQPISKEIIDRLMSLAKVDTDFRYWEMPNGQGQSKIETAAYALLTLCNHDRLDDATSVARWLMSQRNSLGGFSSTQDTVVGLQALAEFAAKLSGVLMNLKISATMKFADLGQPLIKDFMVTPSNAMLLQSFDLPRTRQSLQSVQITVSGTGVGLIQLALKYNVLSKKLTDSGDFELIVIEQFDARRRRSAANDSLATVLIKTCISPKTADVKSGMVVAEIGIPTGYDADLEQTKNLNRISTEVPLKRIELGDRKLVFYFDRTADATCVTSRLLRKSEVRNAQQPVARVYSYYEPEKAKSTLYTFSGLSEEQEYEAGMTPKPSRPEQSPGQIAKQWFSNVASAVLSWFKSIF